MMQRIMNRFFDWAFGGAIDAAFAKYEQDKAAILAEHAAAVALIYRMRR
jgi:hypothetical protein